MLIHEISGLMQFHLNVADVAQKIRITAAPRSNAGALPIPLIGKLLLSSKCNDLVISDRLPNTKYTTEESEGLLEVSYLTLCTMFLHNIYPKTNKFQLFHHSGKKISLTIPVEAPMQAATIGEYTINTTLVSTTGYMLTIKHQCFSD